MRHYDVTDAFIDAVGPVLRYQALLEALFAEIPHIEVVEKAEDRHVSVAAASIIAKHVSDTTQARFPYHSGREAGIEQGKAQ